MKSSSILVSSLEFVLQASLSRKNGRPGEIVIAGGRPLPHGTSPCLKFRRSCRHWVGCSWFSSERELVSSGEEHKIVAVATSLIAPERACGGAAVRRIG
jgi:hypothetical protein